MGYKYNPHRSRNLYDPASDRPFRISRSKIDRFVECPRCFYIDRRLGTDRPPGFPFNINSAVDTLLKTEFDTHRAAGTPHPLQQAYDIDRERQEMFFAALDRLRKGNLVCVFDGTDRVQHMFWRYVQEGHPAAAGVHRVQPAIHHLRAD